MPQLPNIPRSGRSKPLAEATINPRLAALKALVVMGLNLGVCDFTLARVKGEKLTKYRDTSAINSDTFSAILATCDRATLAGKRDYALLRLLWSNALRRAFVSKLSIGDFDRTNGTLKILGKGRGTESQIINLGDATSAARGD